MINIVFITDDNYYNPTMVAIRSLIDHCNSKSKYCIYVLYNNLSIEKCRNIEHEEKENVLIKLIDCKDYIPEINHEHIYVSNTSLIKFFIGDILTDIPKALYIDDDVLINGDVAKIYDEELNDTYAGVVLDMNCMLNNFHKRINSDIYFNSGVMLLNLECIRKNNISNALIEHKINDENQDFMDQDSFNVIFQNNITIFPPTYNFISVFVEYFSLKEVEEFYGCKIKYEDILIYHLAGESKPWNNANNPSFVQWSRFLNSKEEYLILAKSIYNGIEKVNNKLSNNISDSQALINSLETRNEQLSNEIRLLNDTIESIREQHKNEIHLLNDTIELIKEQHRVDNEALNLRILQLENSLFNRIKRKIKKIIKSVFGKTHN